MAEHDDPPTRESSEVKRPRRFQTGLRGLIALVACFALILWMGGSCGRTAIRTSPRSEHSRPARVNLSTHRIQPRA